MARNPHPRGVMRAFVAIIIISFVVLTVQGYYIEQTRTVTRQNAHLIKRVASDDATIAQLEKAQADSCANFTVLKNAVNDFHGTIRDLLRNAIKTDSVRARKIRNQELRRADRQAVATARDLLKRTHIVKAACAQKTNPVPPPGRN